MYLSWFLFNCVSPLKYNCCALSTSSELIIVFLHVSANSSPKIFGPSHKRIEGLSIVEQNELKGAAWFQAGIPREISLEVLSRQSPGAFLVRGSTKPGCFALSLRVPPPAPKVSHYLILRTSRGYKIKVISLESQSIRKYTYSSISTYFCTGFHKRVSITSSSDNTPLGYARTAARATRTATTTKHSSTATSSGRFRYVWFAHRFPKNDVRPECVISPKIPLRLLQSQFQCSFCRASQVSDVN